MPGNPFATDKARPGDGRIEVAHLPPGTSVLRDLNYQYPLKLIAPAPVTVHSNDDVTLVHTVFILTYGGGLVGGDSVDFTVDLDKATRLVLLTQGSTKVFKSENPTVLTSQRMTVDLGPKSCLCYLPDPVQPFAESCFEQRQIYDFSGHGANICALDWVSEGRSARGECWSFYSYASRNEVWRILPDGSRVLLIRDNLILDNRQANVRDRMHKLGCFGTLILGGAVMRGLGKHFLDEFKTMPRIGARQWDDERTANEELSSKEQWRLLRLRQEAEDGVLWSAAASRGFVVVKFGSVRVEGGKRWLYSMLKNEGTVERIFGEGATLCLR